MASKKASEGIALLSMYNDEEDEDMEDAKAGDGSPSEGEDPQKEPPREEGDYMESSDREDEIRVSSDRAVPAGDSGNDGTPQLSRGIVLRDEAELARRRRDRLLIVDYAHDEAAMSPQPEQGVESILGARVQSVNGEYQEDVLSEAAQVISPNVRATPHSSDQQEAQLDTPNQDSLGSGTSEAKLTAEVSENVDPLDEFLPSPPRTKCSEELQEKVRKFIAYKRAGRSFNAEVRNRKDYRNPDFLLHAVQYQDIDQIGSCFSKDVFDPHGYYPSDYYDQLEIDAKREAERRELERKKSQQVDFVSGGTQIANLATAAKLNLPIAVSSAAAAASLRSASTVGSDVISREGRQNKKSKWDKVDTGGQDAISAVGGHAAHLSAATAGAGYTAFAEQRRREVERKSWERKSEKKT